MRILFVSLIESLWGGSEELWSQTALAATRKGAPTAAFFPYYKEIAQIRSLRERGVRIYYGTPPPTRWWKRFNQPSLRTERFAAALAEFRPDLVLFNQGGACDGLVEMALCRKAGIMHVILNQSVEPLHYPDSIWRDLRAAHKGAVKTWCVSRENLAALKAYLCLDLPSHEVVTNAYACPYSVDFNWPTGDSFSLAMVGRLDPHQKGQDVLLDVLADSVWKNRPVTVNIFGEGPAGDLLEAKRLELDLPFVRLWRKNRPVSEIWTQNHALLMPSRFEGQSLAMIEAMLHARPVIACPVGGTGGVVIDGKTGFLADRIDDPDNFRETLERAWASRGDWAAIGQQARAHIRGITSPDPGEYLLGRLVSLIPLRP